jgi:hypothetical protein
LELKDGLENVIKRLILKVDKNDDNLINYYELFKKQEKSTFAGVIIKEEQQNVKIEFKKPIVRLISSVGPGVLIVKLPERVIKPSFGNFR